MNATVYANGMKVEAVSDGSLYISNASSEPTYSDITLGTVKWTDGAVGLKPTSTTNLTNWFYAPAEFATAYGKASTTNYTQVNSNDIDDYRLKKTVYVRSEKDFSKLVVSGITISTTAGTTDDLLKKAVTVAFKVDHYSDKSQQATSVTQNSVFIANEDTSRRHDGVISTTQTDTLTFVAADSVGTGNTQTTQTIWSKSGSTVDVSNYVFQIDIYIYFDGQSESCYSNALLNAITLNADISVAFATETN